MNLFICQTIAIGCGYILDLLIGDPHWLYHPVRLIGNLISWLESILLKEKDTSAKKYRKGMVLAILTPLITGIVIVSILVVGYHINMILGCVIETIMCYQILAVKSLKVESMKVHYALDKEGLQQARNAVAMIVGRDTKQLDEHGVVRAAVETVAENTSDGVIAPLFYMMLFGAAGGFVYKAVNTMDSMIGYKNDKYLYFGRFAAKLDDVVNFIPARIGGCLMVVSAGIAQLAEKCNTKDKTNSHYSIWNAWKIFKSDRKKHSSPNAAQTESACAGALKVALSGDNYYFGKLVHKPQIGQAIRPLEAVDIGRSNILLYITAFLMVIIVLLIRLIIMLAVR